MAATSRRIAGKQLPVSRQVSLGPVNDDRPIIPSRCARVGERRLGDVGALIAVAEELGVLSAFDEHAPGDGLSPSLGDVALAVALQRVCEPGAKRALPAFLEGCLPVFGVMKSGLFTGQTFHRVTRGVGDEVYEAVQRSIAKAAVERFGVSTEVLAYDSTNFDTFIDTRSDVSLAQRGKAKSKRCDLRVVGLVLMTSTSGCVPLFHRTYAGNENDKTVLAQTLEALASLHKELGEGERTLVRDGGFYSEQLELDLDLGDYHSITALALSSTVARKAQRDAVGNLTPLPGDLHEVRAWRGREQVGDSGLDRTVVVVESPELLRGQLRGLSKDLTHARQTLASWTERLREQRAGTARGRHLTKESLEGKVAELLKRQWLSDFLRVSVESGDDGLVLRYQEDAIAHQRLIEERLGKRVLITDQHSWSTEQIVRAFRSQWHVERSFRRLKRGDVSPWGPSYQWTNDSLRAHTFATVLGLQLATLAALRMQKAGMRLSVKESMNVLADIKLTVLRERPEGRGRPRDVLVAPRMEQRDRKLVGIFALDRWSPLISATQTRPSDP